MKLFHHPQGPNIKAVFHVKNGAISEVTLAEHKEQGCYWQIEIQNHLVERWMVSYCEKRAVPQLPLLWPILPPYTLKVLHTLPTISFGETVTYRQLAELTGNPKAYRAVGNGCGSNPFPLIIPCHRVIANGGKSLGGFSCGIEIKKILLSFENSSLNINNLR